MTVTYDTMDQVMKLWWEYNKKELDYKNWWNMENNNEYGVLNKDFIKKHLQRESELEDKIFELENKIKALRESEKCVINTDDIGVRLLTKIAMRMEINLRNDINGIAYGSSWYDMPTLSVYDVVVDNQEVEYLRSLVEPQLTNEINSKIANMVPPSNTYADNIKYLADDRASCYVNDIGKVIGEIY